MGGIENSETRGDNINRVRKAHQEFINILFNFQAKDNIDNVYQTIKNLPSPSFPGST